MIEAPFPTAFPVPDPAGSQVLTQRIAGLTARIDAAALACGRAAGAVTLTAVVKTQTRQTLADALSAGLTVFGENRVQEARDHWAGVPGRERLELRLIGPLQTNKALDAVRLFDVIETLDRPALADALAKACAKTGRSPRLLVQVNTGAEPQKAGVLPDDVAALLAHARTLGLRVDGLMCIPPVDEPPEPHFTALADLAARHGLGVLSMGMSGDWETAVRCGATHIRLGTALFGAR